MQGWCGKILRVNLTNGTISIEALDQKMAKDFIGGRGLGSKILYNEVSPQVDPLGPDNKLIFAIGPLTGTAAPVSGRHMVITKSPLTNTIACSNSGGFWGFALKAAGYDAIIFEGRAEKPVYILIEDDEIELKDAVHLWGKTTHETEDMLHEEIGKGFRIAEIGPAGEKLSKLACVINDKHRAAGRSGVGAVMGSKNLKAVAVKGSKRAEIANPDDFKAACNAVLEKIKTHPITSQGLPAYGTALLVNIINASGAFPTNNFQQAVFAGAEKISGETIAKDILIKNKGCAGCSILCARETKLDGTVYTKYSGSGEGPEYESIWALGACCGIDDLGAVTKANYLCNELGLDTISAGVTVACAMELYEKGYIKKEEVGHDLKFGNGEAMVDLIEKMGLRKGFGDILAEGSYRLAEKYGHPELSMTTKKQEYPAYDPRGIQGIGLNFATSNRGACHVRGYTIAPEIAGVPQKLDPHATEGKAFWVKAFQDVTAIVDSAGLCLFTTFAIGADDILPMINGLTGAGYTIESLMAAGERIYNLERMFNLKAGLTGKDDTLAPRLLNEPIPEGPAKGLVSKLGTMLPEYYQLRGWDSNGNPGSEKLSQLG